MTETTAVASPARRQAPISREPSRSTFAASRTALRALILRDLVVLRKNFGEFVARTLIQPFLLVFVFLYVFPRIGQGVGGGRGPVAESHFATVLVPGVVAISIMFQGIQAVALPDVERVRLHARDRGSRSGAVPDLAGGDREGALRRGRRACSPP